MFIIKDVSRIIFPSQKRKEDKSCYVKGRSKGGGEQIV